MNENLKRWLRACIIALIIFAVLSIYLYVRRGYYNPYIINKVFGSTAVALAAITLIVGPLRRLPFVVRLMTIRRHLGILAFAAALIHVIISLSLTERFEWFSWYIREWIPVTFGIIVILIWGYMTYISRNKKVEELGAAVWKRNLSIAGKIGFLAIFLHVVIMKYEGWIRWFNGQTKQTPQLANPSYPPASLFIFAIMLIVIIYRIIHDVMHKRGDVEKK